MNVTMSCDPRRDREARWLWYDGMTWQSYDEETNSQIECAYLMRRESVRLDRGAHFAKYPDLYRVYFEYNTHPASCCQLNVMTKDHIQIKRTLVFKAPSEHTENLQSNHHHHHKEKRIKKKKRKSKHSSSPKRKQSASASASCLTPIGFIPSTSASSTSLLSAIKRIQVYKQLYTLGFAKPTIDAAIKVFNDKFTLSSPVLHGDLSLIVDELVHIIKHSVQQQRADHDKKHDEHRNHRCNGVVSQRPVSDEEQGSRHTLIAMIDEEETKHSSPSSPSSSPPSSTTVSVSSNVMANDFRIGAWIEVNVNNNWLPGKIMDINWSSRSTVMSIAYQDIFSKRTKQMQLNGADINRTKCRPIQSANGKPPPHTVMSLSSTLTAASASNAAAPSSTVTVTGTATATAMPTRGRFDFADDDRDGGGDHRNGHRSNGHRNHDSSHSGNGSSRFNRNNLSVNRFSFEYHKDNKKYDEKNAKHPSEYINRKCFKCKGSGKCQLNAMSHHTHSREQNQVCLRCKSTGLAQLPCGKCINSSGVYRKSHTLTHSKCNGAGCARCDNTGTYPLHDILCNNCKGSGVYKVKCTACNNAQIMQQQHKERELNGNTLNGSSSQQRYNSCLSGYRLPQLIPFVPKRSEKAVHGAANHNNNHSSNGSSSSNGNHRKIGLLSKDDLNGMHNMKRLFHATDKEGADGIIETGLIQMSTGDGIYFTDNTRSIEIKAKQMGYLVIADVFIGNSKDEYYVDHDMHFDKLHASGYDSIRGHWNDYGVEYVVYHWDQVWVHVVLPADHVNFAALR